MLRIPPRVAAVAGKGNHLGLSTLRQAALALLGLPVGSKAHHRHVPLRSVMLVEVYTAPGSAWGRWQARRRRDASCVSTAVGCALRICLPRRLRDFAKKRRALPTNSPPPRLCRPLRRGEVLSWELNLSTPSHRQALMHHLTTFQPPEGIDCVHLHTSTPCGWASSVQRFNHARGIDLSETREMGKAHLDFTRDLHKAFSGRDFDPGVEKSRSHEQASGASVILDGGGSENWPWALGPQSERVPVSGCAVGLLFPDACGHEQPCAKSWTFESDAAGLLAVLRRFRCSHDHVHVPTLSFRGGRKGVGTKATEEYPPYLGALLAAALCLRTR